MEKQKKPDLWCTNLSHDSCTMFSFSSIEWVSLCAATSASRINPQERPHIKCCDLPNLVFLFPHPFFTLYPVGSNCDARSDSSQFVCMFVTEVGLTVEGASKGEGVLSPLIAALVFSPSSTIS